jgi:hypothetical protein
MLEFQHEPSQQFGIENLEVDAVEVLQARRALL